MAKKKKITIEDLAMMGQHGLAETARQTDLNAWFDAVDKRAGAVDKRLEHYVLGLQLSGGEDTT